MALGRTAKYYRDNPEARAKHRKYQLKYNRRPEEVDRRVEDNKKNREFGTYGNGDKLDVSHGPDGKVTLEPQSENRGSTTQTPGDRRARGKKAKKKKNK